MARMCHYHLMPQDPEDAKRWPEYLQALEAHAKTLPKDDEALQEDLDLWLWGAQDLQVSREKPESIDANVRAPAYL